MVTEIRRVHEMSRKTYGSPRITAELRAGGIRCGKNRIARLMKEHRIVAKTHRRFKVTTDAQHRLPVAPNLLEEQASLERPNQAWASDITYVWTQEGWLYLAAILDLFSRQVVGWAMEERISKELVANALCQALGRRSPDMGLIFHSDRGSQYASQGFRELLDDNGIVQSMSGKGNCYDNAIMESFFHTLKTEVICFEKYRTRAEARQSIFEYIEVFYNRIRRHSALNYSSPEEFEMRVLVA